VLAPSPEAERRKAARAAGESKEKKRRRIEEGGLETEKGRD
jgi:hypothetical protein